MENILKKIVFVGTFPPTEEGIATFNEDLVNSASMLLGPSAICSVAAINLRDTSPYYFDSKVILEIDQDTVKMYKNAAKILNKEQIDAVIIQHEYGIFGGEWGEYLLEFMKSLNAKKVTVMHTVLATHEFKPDKFREVTDKIIEYSDNVVVLSKNSQKILEEIYPNFKHKISYIPHGIHPVKFIFPTRVKKDLGLNQKTVLTTFGLLSRNKGIEHVLKSLPKVIKNYPNVLYQILGQTHPTIRKQEGEKYRTELVSLVRKLKLRKYVRFVDKYLSLDEIMKYLQGTDVYIATSTNKDQAVSGTFSYALGSGTPVVSTDFVQAREMLTRDLGRIVPIKDPAAFSEALIELFSDKKRLSHMNKSAYKKTRSMLWSNVSKKYIKVIDEKLLLPRLDLSHLKRMTRSNGLLQFAKYDLPAGEFGITVDDNARALIAVNWLIANEKSLNGIMKLYNCYFKVLKRSRHKKKGFVNYFDINFLSTPQNEDESPTEHIGRALWAIAESIKNLHLDEKHIKKAKRLWNNNIIEKLIKNDNHARPKAFLIKALYAYSGSEVSTGEYNEIKIKIVTLADFLVKKFKTESTENWQWFENNLSYNNAILPESLALAYKISGNNEYLKTAEQAFKFFIQKTFMGDVYVPIGQKEWYKKGGRRSYYDQQPEDVSSTVLGLITMFEVTRMNKYRELAKNAFSWFLGNNLNGIPIVNFKTGGIYDGLQEEGVNKNQGAESLVSYLLARIKIENYY